MPFKMKQSRLADFFNDSTKTAAHKEDAHKEEVKSARRLKTSKEKKSKKDQPTSQVRRGRGALDGRQSIKMATSTKWEK
jgi:hypothetical protein